MAKSIGFARGNYSGRCGTEVYYFWKRRQCVRSYNAHIAYPNTARQKVEREWFISMVRFASKASQAIKLGLCASADREQMSESNYFVRRNKHCFHNQDGELGIDFQHLVISEGPASDVFFGRPRFEDNEVVEVMFEKNSPLLRPSGDDNVYLFFYNTDLSEGFLSAPAQRRSKRVRVRLPQQWAACAVQIYGFVVDRESHASNSTYIGCGRLNFYEENGQYLQINKDWKEFVDCAMRSNTPAAVTDLSEKEISVEIKPQSVRDKIVAPPEVPK